MKISTLIKGAVVGAPGDVHIASTPKPASLFLPIENSEISFSKNIASLYAVKQGGTHSLTIVHVQGQHVGQPGRIYDTRIYYSVEAAELRSCSNKLGSVLNSLPRMQTFEREQRGGLSSAINVVAPADVDSGVAKRLCNRIMQAIVESKYLLISLDSTDEQWSTNGVLENKVAKTFFSALNLLPPILLPCASFALSVDEQCTQGLLSNFRVIVHHGSNSYGLRNTIEIAWGDLTKAAPDADFMCKTKLYEHLAESIVKESGEGVDLFDSDLSSLALSQRMQEVKDKMKQTGELDIFVLDKDWKGALRCRALNDRLIGMIRSQKYDLTEIYTLFEGNLHDEIIKLFADVCSWYYAQQTYEEETAALCAIENRLKIEPALKGLLVDSLTLHLLYARELTPKQLVDLGSRIGCNYKERYKKQLVEQTIDCWKVIFQSKSVDSALREAFAQTTYYKNNVRELCRAPFLSHLDAAKKRKLREKYFSERKSFNDLFERMTYDEIVALSIDDMQRFDLFVLPADKERFAAELYSSCKTLGKMYEIYKAAKVKPASELLHKFAVRTDDDLAHFAEMRSADNELPTIDIKNLIASTKDVKKLLERLANMQVAFDASWRQLVENRVKKDGKREWRIKKLLSKYFPMPEQDMPEPSEPKSTLRNAARHIALFFKAHKSQCFIVLALIVGLVVGFCAGFFVGMSQQPSVTPESTAPEPMHIDTIMPIDTISITLYFSPLDTLSNERIDSCIVSTFKLSDTLILFNFVDAEKIWLDSIMTDSVKLYDKQICDFNSRREFKDFVNDLILNINNHSDASTQTDR